MALNYKAGTETQSAITADTNGATIDLIGYSGLAVSTIFGTCTGQAANGDTATTQGLWVETSNDNSNWHKILQIAYETDHSAHDSDTHFDYIPDHTAAIASPALHNVGFGRYIRFIFAAANYTGGSVTYTVKWVAKE
jgi:hypothetical protein